MMETKDASRLAAKPHNNVTETQMQQPEAVRSLNSQHDKIFLIDLIFLYFSSF